MGIHFLRGNSQNPKGHAIFIARSTRDSRIVYSTYCLVPPIPMSLAKYLPPLFAAQIPSEDLQGAANIAGMPIPPMLEEGMSPEELQILAERRDDDLCDIGTVSSEEMERMHRHLQEKYRGKELVTAANGNREHSAKLAELYLSRAYKLLDEEYAAIPPLDRAIRDLQA